MRLGGRTMEGKTPETCGERAGKAAKRDRGVVLLIGCRQGGGQSAPSSMVSARWNWISFVLDLTLTTAVLASTTPGPVTMEDAFHI